MKASLASAMESPPSVSPEAWVAGPPATGPLSRLLRARGVRLAGSRVSGCSLGADQVANLAHLNARDTTLAYASRAPQPDIARLKARMGWAMPWYTITDSFDKDFGVDEWHGHNVFIRDGDKVFRTYFINNRGDEAMGTVWSYLDITALGRQEAWEDSPEGYPQTRPYKWWNWHDSYVPGAAPDKRWVEVSDAGEAAFRKKSG